MRVQGYGLPFLLFAGTSRGECLPHGEAVSHSPRVSRPVAGASQVKEGDARETVAMATWW